MLKSSRPTGKTRAPARPQEAAHRRAPLGIRHRRHVAARLVEHEVDGALDEQALAAEEDLVDVGVDLAAELADDAAVDLDAAGDDQLLGLAARSDAGLRQETLQSHFGHGQSSLRIRSLHRQRRRRRCRRARIVIGTGPRRRRRAPRGAASCWSSPSDRTRRRRPRASGWCCAWMRVGSPATASNSRVGWCSNSRRRLVLELVARRRRPLRPQRLASG